MATINIGGQEIPALAIAAAVPLLCGLYAADAIYFGFTGIGYSETTMAAMDRIAGQEAGVEEKKKQAIELKQRTKEIDQIKAETSALQKSIDLLRSKIPSDAQVPVLLYDIERMTKAADSELVSFDPKPLRAYGSAPGSAPLPPPPPPPSAPPKKPKAAAAGSESSEGGAEDGAAPAEGSGGKAKRAAEPPPAPRPALADIMEMPVEVTAEATYPQVIKLLNQLGTYERKLNVSNLQLSPKSGSAGMMSTNDKGQAMIFKNTLSVKFDLTAYVLKKPEGQP